MERVKQIQANKEFGNLYFWRFYLADKEIDFTEEKDSKPPALEFKWSSKASGNLRLPKNFLATYGGEIEGVGKTKNHPKNTNKLAYQNKSK